MKKSILTSICVVIVLTTFAQIPTNGLVGYWPFSGNAEDMSGNNHHGTVNGATLTIDRFGNANSAYQFDGVNDYIYITNSSLITGNTMSYSVWALKQGSANGGVIQTGNMNAYTWTMYGNDSIGYGVTTTTGGYPTYLPSSLLNMGAWNHYVMVYDGSTVKGYINGQLVGSRSANGDVWTSQVSHLTFGVYTLNGNPYDAFFNGKIDDIRLYDVALDSNDVLALYNEGLCYQLITVTDTLIINANLTGYTPITYQNTIKIYPNPTNDHITIDFGANYSTMNGYTLKITNPLGQIVYETPVNVQQTTVDLNGWSGNGVYFVYLIDDTDNILDIRKIVLQ